MERTKPNCQSSIKTYATRGMKEKQNGGQTEIDNTSSMEIQEARFGNFEDKLDKIMQSLNNVNDKFDKLENRQIEIEKKVNEIESSLEFGQKEIEDLKKKVEEGPKFDQIKTLTDKIEDLENRSRRNNFIIYNIPEEAEGEMACEDFMTKFLESVGLNIRPGAKNPVTIERAHRIGEKGKGKKTRPMISKVLNWRDRLYILKNAPAIFKKKEYKGNSLFIGDDVSIHTRKQRQRLAEYMKKLRSENKFAYIPFTVPPVLITKNDRGNFVRILPGEIPDTRT